MSWLDPQRYSLPVVISIALHGVIILLFLFKWPTDHQVPEPVPQHMIANVVQTENKTVKKREEQAAKEQQRKAQAAKREADRKKQLAEQKRREQQALKEKQLAEKRAKEKAVKEAKDKAAKEKAAEEKAQQQAKERAQQEKQLLEQLAKEQAAAEKRAQEDAARRAEEAAAMSSDAITAIRSKVESLWQYPPAVNPEQEVELHITLVPTGQVIDVRIIKSSGNTALDRSVEQAVRKASPLPVPKDPRVFEQSFRKLTMKFRPENATW